MATALKAIKGGHKQGDRKPLDEKSIRPHCKISIEDINWVRQQAPCVQQLWLDSVAAEQFGGAAHKLDTNLTYKSMQKAGAALAAQGLFQYEEVFGRLPSGRPGLISYRVRNLHGYYNRFYWESSTSGETNSCDEKGVQAGEQINQAERKQNHSGVEPIQPDLEQFQKNGQKSEDLQGFQKPNNVSNHPLTTYQQPTKVVGKVVSPSTPNENSHGEETADAPLKGASPQTVESVEERKELPTVTDCTSLALVDAVPSQPALLLNEKQDLGVEPRTSHEDHNSAAPVASGFENSVTQSEEPVGQSQPISLLSENQDLGDEPGTTHEGHSSAAPVASNFENSATQCEKSTQAGISTSLQDENIGSAPSVSEPETQPDKWSSEAISLRSKARPWRMEKLKMAGLLKENPGLGFLMECWQDDPALQIVITGLVRKCQQWGYVVVNGELVKWERE
ncbi:hypothetical protein [Nostoc parmelioides]|uniref:Uncharacterized protein n=1 Tax=Nostoc parmelioides FACHB-3921 TaxID=2692909 RepID=A0ABR8BII3_9NOSO|nr:hypothetical protein [Nostoc parmelioides]MBD2253349.1 hypothetical protein [Nostoc parmelioides FACHB-3921]